MWDKIVNPKTGKKVSIHGKVGRHILKRYIRFYLGGTVNMDRFIIEPRDADCSSLEHWQCCDETNDFPRTGPRKAAGDECKFTSQDAICDSRWKTTEPDPISLDQEMCNNISNKCSWNSAGASLAQLILKYKTTDLTGVSGNDNQTIANIKNWTKKADSTKHCLNARQQKYSESDCSQRADCIWDSDVKDKDNVVSKAGQGCIEKDSKTRNIAKDADTDINFCFDSNKYSDGSYAMSAPISYKLYKDSVKGHCSHDVRKECTSGAQCPGRCVNIKKNKIRESQHKRRLVCSSQDGCRDKVESKTAYKPAVEPKHLEQCIYEETIGTDKPILVPDKPCINTKDPGDLIDGETNSIDLDWKIKTKKSRKSLFKDTDIVNQLAKKVDGSSTRQYNEDKDHLCMENCVKFIQSDSYVSFGPTISSCSACIVLFSDGKRLVSHINSENTGIKERLWTPTIYNAEYPETINPIMVLLETVKEQIKLGSTIKKIILLGVIVGSNIINFKKIIGIWKGKQTALVPSPTALEFINIDYETRATDTILTPENKIYAFAKSNYYGKRESKVTWKYYPLHSNVENRKLTSPLPVLDQTFTTQIYPPPSP